ncbi:MAG: hypothetical protein ABI039_08645 [Vicinamibacterales bacterium]
MNPVLRPAIDIPITPYYLIFPFLAFWLLLASPRFRLHAAAALLVCVYGVGVGIAAGTPLGAQALQIVKYFQLFVLFGTLAWLRSRDPAFFGRCTALVVGMAGVAFALAALQSMTGFEFPTVATEESGLWLNTFFYTPNDLALFLGAVLILVLTSTRGVLFKLLFASAVIGLSVRNDAKAVLIAITLILGVLAGLQFARRTRLSPLVVLAGGLLLLGIALSFYAEAELDFNGQEITALALLIDPVQRLVELDPYELSGSVFDRTDALIYAFRELQSNHWLGLGPGGSVHVLTLPNYELSSAKSLHNAVAELAVDLGPVFVIPALLTVLGVLRRLKHAEGLDSRDAARAAMLLSLPFLAVSQSSGYISNYGFWIAAYLLWNQPRAFGAFRRAGARRRPAHQATGALALRR